MPTLYTPTTYTPTHHHLLGCIVAPLLWKIGKAEQVDGNGTTHHKQRIPLFLQRGQKCSKIKRRQGGGGWEKAVEIPPLVVDLAHSKPVFVAVADECQLCVRFTGHAAHGRVVEGDSREAPHFEGLGKDLDGKHAISGYVATFFGEKPLILFAVEATFSHKLAFQCIKVMGNLGVGVVDVVHTLR